MSFEHSAPLSPNPQPSYLQSSARKCNVSFVPIATGDSMCLQHRGFTVSTPEGWKMAPHGAAVISPLNVSNQLTVIMGV